MHRYAPLCDSPRWLEFCKENTNKKNTLYIGTGDYLDFLSFSERRALRLALLHESSNKTLDDLMMEQTLKLCEEMKGMRGHIVGLCEGNHYGEFSNSQTTTTQKMCEILGCKYLGASAFVRLAFNWGTKHASLDVWAHHGTAANRSLGASIASLEKMEQTAEADIYIAAHDHRKYGALKARLRLTKGGGGCRLNQRQIFLGRTGSFLKGYVEDKTSYIAERGLPPTDLGTISIELIPRYDKKNGEDNFYIELHSRT